MPKKPLSETIESKRDLVREAAIESTPVRLDGVGEHPVIQQMASPEFGTMSNKEAVDLALMLQQLVRGQASILDNQGQLTSELARLQEKMQKYDDDAKKWEDDRTKFLEDINRKADKLRVTDPSKKASLAADAMNMEREARQIANAEAAASRVKFEQACFNSKKVKVVGQGHTEQGIIGGQQVVRLANDVVRIKNKAWELPTGMSVEVPEFVATRYAQILRSREELLERQSALSADRNNGMMSDADEVQRNMARINKKYGTSTEAVPV